TLRKSPHSATPATLKSFVADRYDLARFQIDNRSSFLAVGGRYLPILHRQGRHIEIFGNADDSAYKPQHLSGGVGCDDRPPIIFHGDSNVCRGILDLGWFLGGDLKFHGVGRNFARPVFRLSGRLQAVGKCCAVAPWWQAPDVSLLTDDAGPLVSCFVLI